MSRAFQSRWAEQLAEFVRFKNALGKPYLGSIAVLHSFDRFAASSAWQRSKDMAAVMIAWLNQNSCRKPVTVATYLGVLRQFCKFRKRYDPAAFVPDRSWAPQSAQSTFAPHIFSTAEIRRYHRHRADRSLPA